MSENFKTIVGKLNEDADLRDRVMNASSNEERKQIMASAGLPIPTKEEIENAQSLAGVAGAGGSTFGSSGGTVSLTVVATAFA
jgi:hypothetical protein